MNTTHAGQNSLVISSTAFRNSCMTMNAKQAFNSSVSLKNPREDNEANVL